MFSQTPSFSSVLLPGKRSLTCHHVLSPSPSKWTCPLPLSKYNGRPDVSRETYPSPRRPASVLCQLPSLSATLAAIALLTAKPGSSVASIETSTPLTQPSNALSHSQAQHNDKHNVPSKAPQGTLLRVHPGISQEVHTDSGDVLQRKGSPRSNTTNYPHSVAELQGWARTRLQRTMRASRPVRIIRVRPATLGLVGVGAFTSGSVFLRSLSRQNSRRRNESPLSTRDVFSVVSMQIPFCVSERGQMLQTFDELAKNSSLRHAEGMATASRTAATILLEEEGLLEDSTKFAPFIDVFLSDNLECAERRFSGHVATEESRLRKIKVSRPEGKLRQGLYGVVTMVVATMEGVDLECHDENSTVISRLRRALNCVSKLRAGEVAGLELIWVPEDVNFDPLTREQLSDAYPWLKVG